MRHDLEDFTDNPRAPGVSGTAASAEKTAAPSGDTAAFSFSGKRGALFKIALMNALLTILTLGIYRFWAKTRIRRFFWSNIRIHKEPLEYTGTAMELLIGFLVVLAILVPLFAVYEGALFLVSRSPDGFQIGLQVLYAFALLGFFQYAFYRMWRYRFSRTTWRGVRFSQAGSAWKYMGLTLAWLLITVGTLGLAYPWLRHAQWKYRIEHLHYGQQPFAYGGTALDLAKRWVFVIVPPIVILTIIALIEYETLMALVEYFPPNPEQNFDQLQSITGQLAWVFATIGLLYLTIPVLYIWYRVRELNFVVNQSGLAGAGFRARIRSSAIIGWIVVTGATLFIFVGIPGGFIALAFENSPALQDLLGSWSIGLIILGFLALMVISSVVVTVILSNGIIRHIFSNISIINPAALASVTQATATKPEFGEGLADALDVGAF